MKYTVEDINRFRKYIGHAIQYAEDAGDKDVAEQCDHALDFLVYVLDNFYPTEVHDYHNAT